MKKYVVFLLSLALVFSLAACGSTPQDDQETPTPPAAADSSEPPEATGNQPSQEPQDTPEDGNTGTESNALIAYFSRVGNTDFDPSTDTNSTASIVAAADGLQGNTEVIARMIQAEVGGDLFLIETEDTYPVSYDETIDVGQQEQRDAARPALASQVEDMEQYDTVYLGFPNWWGDMPMAVYSFLEEYDLSGKIIVPFVTSGGSGFSGTQSTIAELEPDATVLDGLSIGDGRISGAQEDVSNWLADLGLAG